MSKKWLGALGLLSSAILIGFLVGKHNSWDSSDPNTARIFLARHAKWRRIADDRGQLTLRAGLLVYTYLTGDKNVSVSYVPASQAAAMPMPKVDLDKDVKELVTLTLAPPAETGLLAAILGPAEEASRSKS